jgi:putative transposase
MITLLLHLLRLLPFLGGGHRQLALENLALRHQLAVYKRTVTRPKLRTTDRLFWVGLARIWVGWRQPLLIVTPETVLRWQRRRFREYWTRLSGRPLAGRPPVSRQIRALVVRMAHANPLWGAPRIHGELQKLGIEVAERTVSRLLSKGRTPPSQTWRTFLANHVRDLVSIDLFTVPTVGCGCSSSSSSSSTIAGASFISTSPSTPPHTGRARQIVDAFPNDTWPSYLLRDRDRVYGEPFRHRVKRLGIGKVLMAPHSPWQNPFVERLIGAVRRECLDHVVVLGAGHLRRIRPRTSHSTTAHGPISHSTRTPQT